MSAAGTVNRFAEDLLALGYRPIPIERGGKKSLVKWVEYEQRPPTPEELQNWVREHPGCNWAILTGQASGVDVLDIDPGAPADWPGPDRLLPDGLIVRTPRGGEHRYFQHVPGCRNSSGRLAPHVDIRGDGGYALVFGTVNGGAYQIVHGSFGEARETECPAWLKALILDASRPSTWTPVGDVLSEGARNDSLTRLAGGMRRAGADFEDIYGQLVVENRRRCRPPLDDGEVRGIAESVCRYPAGERKAAAEADGVPDFRPTDVGNANRFVARHGDQVRYCHLWGSWLVWDGKRWARDESGQVHEMARQTARSIYKEAAAAAGRKEAEKLASHAAQSERDSKLVAMLHQAGTYPGVAVVPDDLDCDPWALNVENGTIDLRTGELREHRQADLITKLAPVEYDPQATCPLWLQTLEDVLPDPKVRGYLQRLAGYFLTGNTAEQILPIFYGDGENGKSTICETLLALLGRDYAEVAPLSLLIRGRHDGHPTDRASLMGKRLALCSEPKRGAPLNSALVKALTGQDWLSARFMRQDFFTFKRTHKLLLDTNFKPRISDPSHAIWRRVKLIPFTVTIPPRERDKSRRERLREELPGILNWTLEGCLDWQRGEQLDLQEPEAVTAATRAYRDDESPLNGFLGVDVHVDPRRTLTRKEVRAAYDAFAEREGVRYPMSAKRLVEALRSLGCTEEKRRGERCWKGIALGPGENGDPDPQSDPVPF